MQGTSKGEMLAQPPEAAPSQGRQPERTSVHEGARVLEG